MKRNNIFDMPKTKYYNAEISRYWYHNENLYGSSSVLGGVDPSKIKMSSSRQKSTDILCIICHNSLIYCAELFFFTI